MNRKVKLFSVLFAILLSAGSLFAQEEIATEESPWSVGADFVSRYIWRGVNLGGSSPSIQPYMEFDFGSDNHAFTIGAWGAYSISGTQTGQEADLYVSYTVKEMFSLTVTDYFFPDETVGRNKYFNYNMDWDKINSGEKAQTGHVLEAAISFNGTEKIPVSLMFAMNIWGADSQKFKEEAGVMVPQDKIVMSKYLELGYSTEVKGVAIDVFAGMALDNPEIAKGEPTGFYGQEAAGVINLGFTLSKEIKITDNYSLPVFGSLITNPEAENIFMVFGISF
ncbi:MAG TPA: hypothetical protein DCG75_19755 [Bacteroidales bacterium]|nr:hypothetical protein [Bacteroidales bacterium]